MKARITDRKVFESLRPLDVVAYLRSEGWALAGYYAESATVWKRQAQQVLLPQDSSFADYPRRLAEILDTLAEVENRSKHSSLPLLSSAPRANLERSIPAETKSCGRANKLNRHY